MTLTAVECECGQVYDLEFDGKAICLENESFNVSLTDAEEECFRNREFGLCPKCGHREPPEFLVGLMQDAVEETERGDWLERELRERDLEGIWT